jgi:hypothetical protein
LLELIYNVKSNPPAVEGVCDKCGASVVQRDDETEEAISNRLNVSYHNNRVNHQHQKPFLITLSNGDWIRR